MAKGNLAAGTKYELLLATAEHRTCYNPDCAELLLVTRSGKSVANFEFAHIRDEQRPEDPDADIGWRYWPDDMTLDERNHFSNIILLCRPCHKLIDKIDPRSYSVTLLHAWKTSAEGDSGSSLAAAVGSMTTRELEDLILNALRGHVQTRDVRVTVVAALIDGTEGMEIPLKGVHDILAENTQLRDFDTAVAVRATNHGELPASVTSFDLELRCPGREYHPVLMSPNPAGLNPRLPVRLDSGTSESWVFLTSQFGAMAREFAKDAMFTDIVGMARLATGETYSSDPVGAEDIPMWDDPAAAAELLEKIRSASGQS